MTRLIAFAAAGLLPLVVACAHAPHVEVPHGLTYSCAGETVTIVYNGQGYLPGSTLPAGANQAAPNLRSRATIHWRDRDYEMAADDALENLRFIETRSADEADRRLIWVARSEDAELREIDQDGNESPIAQCQRVRDPAAATLHHGGGDTPHG